MARPKLRKTTRSRPTSKRGSLPASVANAVIAKLFTAAGSGRDTPIVTARAKRRSGALAHPAARGKPAGQRPSLATAVASAVAGRLSTAAPARKAQARKPKPRASLAAAVASAVSRQLAGRAAARRR